MAKVLTPEQQTEYFATQSKAANPISPLEFLRRKTASAAPEPAAPESEPTVGETLNFEAPSTATDYPSFDEIYGSPINEEDVYQQQLGLFQQQIDATNQVYDQMLNEARQQQTGRLGSQRAMAARGGLLGSDFGAAQKEEVVQYGNDIERGIGAERSAAIGAILGQVRQSAVQELAAKRAARQQGAENYLNYLAGARQRKQNNVQEIASALLMQGIDPSTLNQNELASIAGEAGVSVQDILAGYQTVKQSQAAAQAEADLETRKTEAEINKIEADIASGKLITLGEGTMLYNTETGETFKNPKTYKPTSGGGGINAVLGDQDIAETHAYLQANRGEDTFTDTGKYLQEMEAYVNLGGDPKDFVSEFEPDVYINPNDPTRGFLQSQMKKPPGSSSSVFLGSFDPNTINAAIQEASMGQ